jgi:hypothetical protein
MAVGLEKVENPSSSPFTLSAVEVLKPLQMQWGKKSAQNDYWQACPSSQLGNST